jgi:NADH:ubiquinone oxidoreductase subunit D
MERVIDHFKFWTEGARIQSNWTYSSVESPKGEFGVSLIADNTNTPYRCKVRSPAFHNLHALPQITRGHFLADLVALIGTIDVVFGEVDR